MSHTWHVKRSKAIRQHAMAQLLFGVKAGILIASNALLTIPVTTIKNLLYIRQLI